MLRSFRHRRRGFSLIELMITVGLLAVLLMAVIPDMGSWMRSMQIRNQAESVQTGLQRARNEAVRRNRDVRFSLVSLNDPSKMDDTCALSTKAASWVISLEEPAGKCGTAISDTASPMLLVTNPAGAGVAKVKVTASGDGTSDANSVTFDPYGRLKGNLAPIQQIDIDPVDTNDEARKLRIVLTAAGSIRMCDRLVNAVGDPRKC